MGFSITMRKRSSLLGIGFFLLALVAIEAKADDAKRVLLLHSYGRDFAPWSEASKDFRAQLVSQSPEPIDFYEASILEGEAWLLEYIKALSSDRGLDLVVTVGPPAAHFIQVHRQERFAETPVLFAGVDERLIPTSSLTPNDAVAGVKLEDTIFIDNILNLLPDTENIAIVIGDFPLERFWVSDLRQKYKPFEDRVNFIWLNELSLDEIVQRVANLKPRSAVFYTMLAMDGAGVPQALDRALAPILAASNAPVFGLGDYHLGQGIVGGPLVQHHLVSKRDAEVAVRILEGEKPRDVEIPSINYIAWEYDWRALQRWGINEARLPPRSVVRFRDPTAWERYRWQIIVIALALLLQATLIVGLLYERYRRHQAEGEARARLSELTFMNRRAGAQELSASIAHEINQPLAAIVSSASAGVRWLSRKVPNIEEATAALQRIVSDGYRASEVIGTIRALYQKAPQERERCDIDALVDDMLALLQTELREHNISVRRAHSQNAPVVRINKVQIQQVIMNLFLNAADAMRSVEGRSRTLGIDTGSNAAGDLVVTIEDSGPGIDLQNGERIFEPFFTTKSNGMGMGLSISRSIVEAHGGELTAVPGARHGMAFQIVLPGEAEQGK